MLTRTIYSVTIDVPGELIKDEASEIARLMAQQWTSYLIDVRLSDRTEHQGWARRTQGSLPSAYLTRSG